MPRTPEQRQKDRLRYKERMLDPAYAERRRQVARESQSKYRLKDPVAYNQSKLKFSRARKGSGQQVIYFIQVETGPIKIGFTTKTPQARMMELQVGNHLKLKLLGSIPGTIQQEQELHRKFAAALIRSEWFQPTTELLSYITTALQEKICHTAHNVPS